MRWRENNGSRRVREKGRRTRGQEDKKLRKMKGEEKVEEEEDRKECKVMKSKRRNEVKPHWRGGGRGVSGVEENRRLHLKERRKTTNTTFGFN